MADDFFSGIVVRPDVKKYFRAHNDIYLTDLYSDDPSNPIFTTHPDFTVVIKMRKQRLLPGMILPAILLNESSDELIEITDNVVVNWDKIQFAGCYQVTSYDGQVLTLLRLTTNVTPAVVDAMGAETTPEIELVPEKTGSVRVSDLPSRLFGISSAGITHTTRILESWKEIDGFLPITPVLPESSYISEYNVGGSSISSSAAFPPQGGGRVMQFAESPFDQGTKRATREFLASKALRFLDGRKDLLIELLGTELDPLSIFSQMKIKERLHVPQFQNIPAIHKVFYQALCYLHFDMEWPQIKTSNYLMAPEKSITSLHFTYFIERQHNQPEGFLRFPTCLEESAEAWEMMAYVLDTLLGLPRTVSLTSSSSSSSSSSQSSVTYNMAPPLSKVSPSARVKGFWGEIMAVVAAFLRCKDLGGPNRSGGYPDSSPSSWSRSRETILANCYCTDAVFRLNAVIEDKTYEFLPARDLANRCIEVLQLNLTVEKYDRFYTLEADTRLRMTPKSLHAVSNDPAKPSGGGGGSGGGKVGGGATIGGNKIKPVKEVNKRGGAARGGTGGSDAKRTKPTPAGNSFCFQATGHLLCSEVNPCTLQKCNYPHPSSIDDLSTEWLVKARVNLASFKGNKILKSKVLEAAEVVAKSRSDYDEAKKK